jgi:glycosyltransferase involved in cell wall biosynthesis
MMAATPAQGPSPRVTVLIAAFGRREFLLRAVRSALASTVDRSVYELIVVKNFLDPEIDAFLTAHDARVLNETPAPIGAWMARALAVARGKVVCLLNDDDEFEPSKLAVVLERFATVPHLVYYHDRRTLVDADGVPLPTRGRWEQPQAKPFTIASDEDRRTAVGKVHRFRGLFHDSCISVDRTVLDRHADLLSRVEVSEDAFTYYCALASDGTLFFDPQRLTRFRVHARSKYRREKTGPRDPSVQTKRWALIAAIEQITRGTAAGRAARVFRLVTVHQAFLEVEGGKRPPLADYAGLFGCLARYRVPSHALLLGLSAVKVLAPRATSAFFVRLWAFLDDTVT